MDSLSWERGSFDDNGLTDREELLVFGYSAKLFKDEEQARLVDEGRHLVPCQGREDVRIDRSVFYSAFMRRFLTAVTREHEPVLHKSANLRPDGHSLPANRIAVQLNAG